MRSPQFQYIVHLTERYNRISVENQCPKYRHYLYQPNTYYGLRVGNIRGLPAKIPKYHFCPRNKLLVPEINACPRNFLIYKYLFLKILIYSSLAYNAIRYLT